MLNRILITLLLISPIIGCGQTEPKPSNKQVDQLNLKIDGWAEDFVIPGTAVAIIENGEIVLQKGYGYADVKNQIKISAQTGFNIASISKTVTAWGVMKLVEQGKLNLDSPAESYLTRWNLPESEYSTKKVTIRRLLSHTAGLSLHGYPGYAPKDTLPTLEESLSGSTNGSGDVRLIMEPGTYYQYSGGGFTLLQLIIEEVTGISFENYMEKEILLPLKMTNSSFTIDQRILKNSSAEHNAFGEKIDFELFTAKAAAGFQTTIEDLSKFALACLDTNNSYQQVLKSSTLKQMATDEGAAKGRYGLGFSVEYFNGNEVKIIGHNGSNDGWQAALRLNQKTGDGIIILTNSANGRDLIAQVYCDWMDWSQKVWMGNRSAKSITPLFIRTYKKEGIERVLSTFKTIKKNQDKEYYYNEHHLNLFGYELLWKGKVKDAVKLFKMVVEEYPYSFNAYDSYAEALLADGQRAEAIKNYTLSVQMNPKNDNGKEILIKEGVNVDSIKPFATEEEMKKLTGLYTSNEKSKTEWNVHLEFSHGGLLLKDRGMNTALVPLGNNKFVNPRHQGPHDNGLLVFNGKANNKVELKIYDKHSFRKIDENLLETIDTWSQEIFVFPLNFARDINYKGFEDVRFPKGWSNKDTTTFWSYAGAWSIDEEKVFTKKELNAVWRLYFDGLMNDVNKIHGAKLEKTVANFEVEKTTKNSTHFTGKLRVVNAFGANEPIELHAKVEQRICPSSKRSFVLFKFSPSAFNQEVWKELDAIILLNNLCSASK
jgi:CubicO group peptidase (beta-lactamase class C family)